MEWISVKDRLPESNGKFPSGLVLVFCPINGVLLGYKNHGKLEIQCTYCAEGTNITHWMPLPEPPKPDSPTQD